MMATENQTIDSVESRKFSKGARLAIVAVLAGLGIGFVVFAGLSSRVDDAALTSSGEQITELGPIALPDIETAAGDIAIAPEVNALAPDFALQTPDGEFYRLSDLRGRPILLNFWATWCGPCRAEMPALEARFQARQDDGFLVLAVNYTTTDTVPAVVAFGEELGLTFPLLIDEGSKVQDLYRIRAYPSSFFVDEEGIIRTIHFGPMTEGQLDGYVDDLLQ